MANDWNIPDKLEQEVRKRDKLCVYCRRPMKAHLHRKGTPGDKATWEHIDNDEKNITAWNITLCCNSCNASKSAKSLSAWLKSEYCQERGISKKTVAQIIRQYLKK